MIRDAAVCRLLSGADTYSVVVITSQLLPNVHGALLRLQQVLSHFTHGAPCTSTPRTAIQEPIPVSHGLSLTVCS